MVAGPLLEAFAGPPTPTPGEPQLREMFVAARARELFGSHSVEAGRHEACYEE